MKQNDYRNIHKTIKEENVNDSTDDKADEKLNDGGYVVFNRLIIILP